MIIFMYTFAVIFIALVMIVGIGGMLIDALDDKKEISEGRATAAMCTTRLLKEGERIDEVSEEDFVLEQDLVYTYESVNL